MTWTLRYLTTFADVSIGALRPDRELANWAAVWTKAQPSHDGDGDCIAPCLQLLYVEIW